MALSCSAIEKAGLEAVGTMESLVTISYAMFSVVCGSALALSSTLWGHTHASILTIAM